MKAMITLMLAHFPAAVLADPAAALEARYREPAAACWAAAGSHEARRSCEGVLFDACSVGEPDGLTNLGMAMCIRAEHLFWDRLLNTEWERVTALVKRTDSGEPDPAYAVRSERLRAAQRARIAFRDAQCGFDHAIHGSGSISQLNYPSCLSALTYARMLDLVGIRAEFGG